MRRKATLLIVLLLLLTSCSYDVNTESPKKVASITTDQSTPAPSTENTQTEELIVVCDKEILFMNIPWGTSFTKVDEMHGELELWGLSGDSYKTYSVDDIILGEYEGIDFEYDDINIIGNCFNSEVEVAGYTTQKVALYFAYNIVDGTLPKTENESSLYGGQYIFDTENLDGMYSDLKDKLTSLYGEPSKTTQRTDYLDISYTYTWWYGLNNTVVVLKSQDASNDTTDLFDDEITISYAWMNGDELLQNASDCLKQNALNEEESNYGSNNTSGL
ncbi:MAG: hypothetical protein IKK33_07730 [Lachnospiraceae bacterium]|nr:hypothetical protein [Lachnospiraceae bacterium]